MSENKVEIYSTATCPFCTAVKDYLDSKAISYTAYDVAEDREKRAEMVEKSGQMGVPVLDINGTIIVGFERGRINELLGIN
ncbi:MAG TPA: glutaredoxin domain-containing protein [bacterium]|nr:glutaredoxin domain-containing protein [bacterium]